LPSPSLITEPAKTIDLISIMTWGLGGGNFRNRVAEKLTK
jgi:hypothetical protein